jgi:hypothetical protein
MKIRRRNRRYLGREKDEIATPREDSAGGKERLAMTGWREEIATERTQCFVGKNALLAMTGWLRVLKIAIFEVTIVILFSAAVCKL